MTHRACHRPVRLAIVWLMKPADRSDAPNPWAPAPLPAIPAGDRGLGYSLGGERRCMEDRRFRVWWSVIYGSFNPRRRQPPRRLAESRFHSLDWHAAHLLAVAIGILLLSVADALMTVTLLSGGSDEVNPIMAAFIYKSIAVFAVVKMTLTGIGVTPTTTTVQRGAAHQFAATAFDQFGAALANQPGFTWSVVSGIGAVSQTGRYVAPSYAIGKVVIQASVGIVKGRATTTVV